MSISYSVNPYRYGFNGKEKDDEVNGSGNSYDYGFRIYNPRLGKFLSVDPLSPDYPWYTPYQFAGNKPIWAIDLDGLEELIVTLEKGQTSGNFIVRRTSKENVPEKDQVLIQWIDPKTGTASSSDKQYFSLSDVPPEFGDKLNNVKEITDNFTAEQKAKTSFELSLEEVVTEKPKFRTSNTNQTFDLEEKITPEKILNNSGTSTQQLLESDGIDRLKVDKVDIAISSSLEPQKSLIESVFKSFFPNAEFSKTEIIPFDKDPEKGFGGEKFLGISVSQPIE